MTKKGKRTPDGWDYHQCLVDDLENALLEFKLHPLLGQLETLLAIAGYLRRRVPTEPFSPSA